MAPAAISETGGRNETKSLAELSEIPNERASVLGAATTLFSIAAEFTAPSLVFILKAPCPWFASFLPRRERLHMQRN